MRSACLYLGNIITTIIQELEIASQCWKPFTKLQFISIGFITQTYFSKGNDKCIISSYFLLKLFSFHRINPWKYFPFRKKLLSDFDLKLSTFQFIFFEFRSTTNNFFVILLLLMKFDQILAQCCNRKALFDRHQIQICYVFFTGGIKSRLP